MREEPQDPETLARVRDSIRETGLDCSSWPDDVLDEIAAAVIKAVPRLSKKQRMHMVMDGAIDLLRAIKEGKA